MRSSITAQATWHVIRAWTRPQPARASRLHQPTLPAAPVHLHRVMGQSLRPSGSMAGAQKADTDAGGSGGNGGEGVRAVTQMVDAAEERVEHLERVV